MWGHDPSCGCPICTSLHRSFALIQQASPLQGFVHLAGVHVRGLEGELRDTAAYCAKQGSPVTPKTEPAAPPLAACSAPVVAAEKAATDAKGSESASHSQPVVETTDKSPLNFLYPKSKPSSPPKSEKPQKVKSEPDKNPDCLVDVVETEPSGSARARSSGKKPRSEPKRTRSSHSRRVDKDKKKRRSKSRSRRRRGEQETPRASPRREKKRRSSSPVARPSPPRPRTPSHPPGPRSPEGPPPHRHRPQGRGWEGPIPYSNHPRWYHGQNKGSVKRSKQERHYQKRQEQRYHESQGYGRR